jgi:ATP-dependent helicase HrpB
MLTLPIDEALPRITAALANGPACVLTAPPGSGKSTRVPPLLTGLVSGQVYLLQPRRIAAKALARRIGSEQGWKLGAEVGYRVRFDSVGGAATRLWVMTEGSLTRQLSHDPYLDGIGAVILDEFHERSLHTDLAISYLRELQRTVREDLKLIVMSATMDAQAVASFLGDCPIIDAPGSTYPVAISNRQELPDVRLADAVTRAVSDALRDPDSGDILVFLPGMGEIRACERALLEAGIEREICPLHGSLPPEVQDRALSPGTPGTPGAPGAVAKIVLATNVAETSVTIPGVRTVIDTGTARVQRHNPATGLDELRLEPVSRFSLAQRAGRAGRTAPGRCLRLSTPLTDARRPQATDPELQRVDLAGTLLVLRQMEYPDARLFPWFEAPGEARLAAAEDLLSMLGAIRAPFTALTPLGQQLAGLPVHPRVGRLLLDAQAAGDARLGASLAALTGERDVRVQQRHGPAAQPAVADVIDRLELLTIAERESFHPGLRSRGLEPQAAREAAQVRDDLLRAIAADSRRSAPAGLAHDTLIPRLLLAAYPDRVVKRAAPDANRGMMVGGVAVELDATSAVAARSGHPRPDLFLAVACQGLGQGMRSSTVVRQAAELTEADIEAVFPGSIQRRERLTWDDQKQQVSGQIGWFYRDLAIRMARDTQPDPTTVATFLSDRLAPEAAEVLAADDEAAMWLARYRWLRRTAPDLELPPEPEATAVIASLCAGCRSRAEVVAKPKIEALQSGLTWQQTRLLEEWAPTHVQVPTGNRIKLDYSLAEQPPVLAVRLQEMFGQATTPTLANGRCGVLLHLLGPNYRCEQITRDLASFWTNTYPQVRKDLRGRYPKHSWPEDPLTALPVARGRPRQG